MVIPRVLTRSIDIKLGVFPEGTSILDTAKALGIFLQRRPSLRWWRFNSAPVVLLG